MINIILIIYLGCCVVGLTFALCGMKFSSESRKLDRNDLFAAIFFTCSGFFGTAVILYLLIPEMIKKYKEVKAKEQFEEDGGTI